MNKLIAMLFKWCIFFLVAKILKSDDIFLVFTFDVKKLVGVIGKYIKYFML